MMSDRARLFLKYTGKAATLEEAIDKRDIYTRPYAAILMCCKVDVKLALAFLKKKILIMNTLSSQQK